MSKLRLDLDDLAVDTFRTDDDPLGLRGTVDGQEASVTICNVASVKTVLTCCPCTPRY